MRLRARDRLLLALGRVLHLRRSELGRALPVAGLAIVLGCGMYTAFNGTQAIFLVRTGPRAYPAFFISLALAVLPALAALSAANRRWGVDAAFRLNLGLNALLPIAVFAAYRVQENPLVSLLAVVLYSVAFEVLMLQFWAFAGQYFNILEAKRVYPVVAAGSGLGYIFAGAVTSVVVGATGQPELLVFGWLAGCALCVPIASSISRGLRRPALEEDADPFLPGEGEVARGGLFRSLRDALRYLRLSRLVLALVLLAALLLVVMRVSDYLVALLFVSSARDTNDLSVLLGNAWMLSYVVQIALGLWVTPWLLARAGVKNAILALPVATLAGFGMVAWAPRLATALFLFVVRNGLQTGVDDPARNVLDGALPEQLRPRLALLQENLVLPGSAAVTGVGLLVVSLFIGSASAVFLAWLGIAASLALLAGALWVRSLYVGAVFQRLRSHTLALGDLELAFGRPSPEEVAELRAYLASEDPDIRRFAAAALGRLSEEAFAELAPDLVLSSDPDLRRLAFQLAAPGRLSGDLLAVGAADSDPWVVAAAAVAGARLLPPWPRAEELLAGLRRSEDPAGRAAATWSAAGLGDLEAVLLALVDPDRTVRMEAVTGFARLRGDVAGAAQPLLARIDDEDLDVRRETLRQLGRWAAPAADATLGPRLVDALADPDPLCQRLAGEAIAIQDPAALAAALPLLEREPRLATAALEAVFASGRPALMEEATRRLERSLAEGLLSSDHAHRLGRFARLAGVGAEDPRWAGVRVALEDHRERTVEVCLAGLRSLHAKRGFSRIERGLRSADPQARAVAVETLLNFGPPRLVEPLARLLDPERHESGAARPLSEAEIAKLADHPHEWVKRAAAEVAGGRQESMKDLIALKKVPLFATLSLEQLASIDRLMVTRRYEPGEQIFGWGDHSSELYVVLEGEVRIHRDQDGHQVTLARLGANSFMGEMAPFTDEPRSAGAEAVEPTTCRVLRKDRLGAILHDHPEVLLEVIKNLSRRLVVANAQLEAAARAQAEVEAAQPSSRR